jgi:hypothetical protein
VSSWCRQTPRPHPDPRHPRRALGRRACVGSARNALPPMPSACAVRGARTRGEDVGQRSSLVLARVNEDDFCRARNSGSRSRGLDELWAGASDGTHVDRSATIGQAVV